jgi:hypothetical protein
MRWLGLFASIMLGLGLAVEPSAAQFQIKKAPVLKQVKPGTHRVAPTGKTTLKVCAQGSCREGLGAWVVSLTVPPASRGIPYDFSWKTTAKGIKSAHWQVSTKPFRGPDMRPEGLVSEGAAGSPQPGRFTINFSKLPPLKPAGKFQLKPGTIQRAKPGMAFKRFPPRYYVRVVPMFAGKPAAAFSNNVRLDFPQKAPKQANPLVKLPTDVYRVQIVDFDLIKPQTLHWGCVIVTDVDPAKLQTAGFAGAEYRIYEQFRKSGKPYCPKFYKGVGEKKWYEALWEFSSGGVNWVSKAYEGVKKTAVKAVAKAINTLPGNVCNATCEQGLLAGLNTGLVALGVPPSLPNMEDLTNQGMDYLVQTAVAQAGINCDAACQDAIRNGIKDMAKQVQAQTAASYCDATIAHNHGVEPICPPSGVTVKPAPGSASQPARIIVRVTRKPNATVYSTVAKDRLVMRFNGTNYPNGHMFQVATNTCYTDTSVFPCDPEMLRVDGPIRGPLFKPVIVDLPRIAPGKSVDYTFFLAPADYWLPGHKERIKAKGGHVLHNDWWKLYQGAHLLVSADVECPQMVGSPMVSCAPQRDKRTVQVPASGY